MTSEAKPGGRISDIKHEGSSSGAAVGDLGDSKPDWRTVGVRMRVSQDGRMQSDYALEMKEWGGYLVYHINEGLGVIPTEVTDYLDHIFTHESCLD